MVRGGRGGVGKAMCVITRQQTNKKRSVTGGFAGGPKEARGVPQRSEGSHHRSERGERRKEKKMKSQQRN
jgi:hypothetical protein